MILPPNLEYTGERMIPEMSDTTTFWEHVYRYRFALNYVRNKRVVDVACGEGYGTAALADAGARKVIGVDVSKSACRQARARYGLSIIAGSADAIPIASKSQDVVISFETIEHLREPERLIAECSRILVPGGKLVISTPVQSVYSKRISNPFHLSEMDEHAFVRLVRSHFPHIQLFSQQPTIGRWRSRRPFALPESPWLRLKGAWRFRRFVIRFACKYMLHNLTDDVRLRTRELIRHRDGLLASIVNPYAVLQYPQKPLGTDGPTYVVIVARL